MSERINRSIDSSEEGGFSKEAFVFIGPATSGKTSIGDRIYNSLGEAVEKIRGKDIVPERAKELAHFRQVVPDQEFIPAFLRRMEMANKRQIVFENIPRTALQAEAMVSWAKSENSHLNVVVLRLSEDQVVDRSLNRLVCPHCDSAYHPSLKPSITPGVCDRDGSMLQMKPGDNEGDLRRQYKEYLDNLSEILSVLGTSNSSIYLVDSDRPVFEVGEEVVRLFGS